MQASSMIVVDRRTATIVHNEWRDRLEACMLAKD